MFLKIVICKFNLVVSVEKCYDLNFFFFLWRRRGCVSEDRTVVPFKFGCVLRFHNYYHNELNDALEPHPLNQNGSLPKLVLDNF